MPPVAAAATTTTTVGTPRGSVARAGARDGQRDSSSPPSDGLLTRNFRQGAATRGEDAMKGGLRRLLHRASHKDQSEKQTIKAAGPPEDPVENNSGACPRCTRTTQGDLLCVAMTMRHGSRTLVADQAGAVAKSRARWAAPQGGRFSQWSVDVHCGVHVHVVAVARVQHQARLLLLVFRHLQAPPTSRVACRLAHQRRRPGPVTANSAETGGCGAWPAALDRAAGGEEF